MPINLVGYNPHMALGPMGGKRGKATASSYKLQAHLERGRFQEWGECLQGICNRRRCPTNEGRRIVKGEVLTNGKTCWYGWMPPLFLAHSWLMKFSSSPLNFHSPGPKKETHLPAIHFQVFLLFVSGRVVSGRGECYYVTDGFPGDPGSPSEWSSNHLLSKWLGWPQSFSVIWIPGVSFAAVIYVIFQKFTLVSCFQTWVFDLKQVFQPWGVARSQ